MDRTNDPRIRREYPGRRTPLGASGLTVGAGIGAGVGALSLLASDDKTLCLAPE